MYKGYDMPVKGAANIIHHAIMECTDVSAGDHRFGGTEYKLGKREIGHVHGDYLVDIPFSLKVRNEIINKGEAQPHYILPESGWVSIYLRKDEDVDRAINLLKRSYEIVLGQKKKKELFS